MLFLLLFLPIIFKLIFPVVLLAFLVSIFLYFGHKKSKKLVPIVIGLGSIVTICLIIFALFPLAYYHVKGVNERLYPDYFGKKSCTKTCVGVKTPDSCYKKYFQLKDNKTIIPFDVCNTSCVGYYFDSCKNDDWLAPIRNSISF